MLNSPTANREPAIPVNDEIDRLRAELAAVTDDYLRVHKDKMDYFEEIARLREALKFYAPGPYWYNARIANDNGETAARALTPRPFPTGNREPASQLLRACEKVNDLEAAARRDADEIARLHSIVERAVRLLDEGQSGYISGSGPDMEWDTQCECLIADARAALAPRPPVGKGE